MMFQSTSSVLVVAALSLSTVPFSASLALASGDDLASSDDLAAEASFDDAQSPSGFEASDDEAQRGATEQVIRVPVLDPWKSCANYAQLQNALKGTADFIATGVSLQCTWNSSDVQPSITIKNQTAVYFAPGSTIFYCTKGGAVGKKDLWGASLASGASMNVFVPFGSGNTCLAKGIYYTPRNPPR